MIIRWITFMLEARTAQSTAVGITKHREVERRCPQGGVLSPLLWNLLVDEVLTMLRETYPQIYSQGYADDIGLAISGIDPSTVISFTQQALNAINTWCMEVDLSVNPDKITALICTNKTKYIATPLHLNGTAITYKYESRYLGVILDSKLTWKAHCRARASSCVIALAQCKRGLGKTWGLSPIICAWIYTAIIRPKLAYAALVWLPAVEKIQTLKDVEKVQILALINIFGAMRSTPTAAMVFLGGIPPLCYFLHGEALKCMTRLTHSTSWRSETGFGYIKKLTHSDLCKELQDRVVEATLRLHKNFFPLGGISLLLTNLEVHGHGLAHPKMTRMF